MARRIVLLVAVAATLTLGLSGARRDEAPPELWVEVERRVAADQPFDLFLSADEPVTYRVRYGELELEQVAQDYSVSLLALPGVVTVQVAAADAAGNEAFFAASVEGVPSPRPTLQAPAEASAGEPLTLEVRWDPRAAKVVDLDMEVGGRPGPLRLDPGRAVVLSAVPLGSPDGVWPLAVALSDEFGGRHEARSELVVRADPRPVEELSIPAAILGVVTPEGRELEESTLARAFAEAESEPLWSEPFLLPIEGRSTSGFGSPRRYAAGGNVSYHLGSDIAAPEGTPILATNAGRVTVAGQFPIKGGLVVIDHGAGVSSLYFHQSRIHVTQGEFVERGQPIGEVGSTGLSTGPHLHWEMRVAGVPSNPMSWVGKTLP